MLNDYNRNKWACCGVPQVSSNVFRDQLTPLTNTIVGFGLFREFAGNYKHYRIYLDLSHLLIIIVSYVHGM